MPTPISRLRAGSRGELAITRASDLRFTFDEAGDTKDALRDVPKIVRWLMANPPGVQIALIAGAGHVPINTDSRVVTFLRTSVDFAQPDRRSEPAQDRAGSP